MKLAFLLHYWVMELRFGFAYQLVISEHEVMFLILQRTITEVTQAKGLPKVLWAKEIEAEPAIFTTGSSGDRFLLFSSHSSNIITL